MRGCCPQTSPCFLRAEPWPAPLPPGELLSDVDCWRQCLTPPRWLWGSLVSSLFPSMLPPLMSPWRGGSWLSMSINIHVLGHCPERPLPAQPPCLLLREPPPHRVWAAPSAVPLCNLLLPVGPVGGRASPELQGVKSRCPLLSRTSRLPSSVNLTSAACTQVRMPG